MILGAIVWADGDDGNKTDKETAVFNSNYGAQVRLLQLDASIQKNILWGDAVLSTVKAKNGSIDTSDLESILAQLKALEHEVSSTTPEAGNETAQAFVDMKDDAVNLSKQFREEVRSILNESDITGLKKKLGQINWNQTRELTEKINKTRCEYNAEKLQEILAAVNISDPDLLDKIKNGTASVAQIKEALKDAFSNMTIQQRKQLHAAVLEEIARENVFMRAAADKVAYNRLARVDNRTVKRIDAAERFNLSGNVLKRLENQKKNVERGMTRIENRTDTLSARIENITNRTINRFENLSRGIADNSSGNARDKLTQEDNKTRVWGDKIKNETNHTTGGWKR